MMVPLLWPHNYQNGRHGSFTNGHIIIRRDDMVSLLLHVFRSDNYVATVKEPSSVLIKEQEILLPSPDSSTHYTLGIIEAPEHATEMTHSRVNTTLKFLQCIVHVIEYNYLAKSGVIFR